MQPIGPSVAMWMASGATAEIRRAIAPALGIATRMLA
jgi:threonine/homoserine/homoserine lactone efflux protein